MPFSSIVEEKNPEIWKVLATANFVEVQGDAKLSTTTGILGKVPVLETSEGTISEANAIVRFLARSSKTLYGKNNFEAGQIDQYIDFSTNYIELPGAVWVYPILGQINNNPAATGKAQADIKKSLEYLNSQLATKTFLVGERITIADIVVAMSLYYLFQKVLDVNFRKPYTNVVRWYTTIVNQAEVKKVIGEVVLCEKAELPSGVVVKTAEKKKDEKPKKEEKPKEEKPKKAEKKPEPADDEEESFEDEEAKGANPLDALPKSSMVFDEWKRQYSNNDTKTVAMPWLWKNFDPQGYSIWKCDYKYNNECQKVFMTCNLIGGWIQRLDKLRKYGFGSICIFGEEPNLEVSGIWIFRGPEIPAEMTFTDDCEHYEWKKLDYNDESTKQLIGDYFAWEGSFGGMTNKFNQGKIFK